MTRFKAGICCAALFLLGSATWAADQAPAPVTFHIEARSLKTALTQFGEQSGLQILFSKEIVEGLSAQGVTGTFTPEAALRQLIAHTGLQYEFVNPHTVRIWTPTNSNNGSILHDGKINEFRMDQGNNSSASSQGNQSSNSQSNSNSPSTGLSEIIVTAQKRSERLQDVPVPVSSISADTLLQTNQVQLEDYYQRVPGLTVTFDGIRSDLPTLVIRGITTSSNENPTVGIVVDDMPYGSSTSIGGGTWVPDLDPGDLERVEVLRGPQGTLYGASSMGGLLKFVTVDPSTDALSGRMQAGLNTVHNGAELGYNVRGSINIPITTDFAILASGFVREDPGYIDNPVQHSDGVNEDRVSGGRLVGLWRPSDVFSLKVSALIQNTDADGASTVNVPTAGFPQTAGLGDLQQNDLRGTGWLKRQVEVFSSNLTAKLGVVDLTSVTGYSINRLSDSLDATPVLGAAFGEPNGLAIAEDNKTKKFNQELRVSSSVGTRFDWLAGVFFTHENSTLVQNFVAVDPGTGASNGLILSVPSPTTYQEIAGFADLTVHFTDQFDIQFGGRESGIKQTVTQGGGLGDVDSKANAFTYLVTPRYRFSSDLMTYARLASGYRPGGINLQTPGFPTPGSYTPDKTENYEIGVKGEALERMISFDASLYYIDWKNIQLALSRNSAGYIGNGGQAKSQGVELSIEARPTKGTSIAAWVAFSDAKLTQDLPPASVDAGVYGVSGKRLPFSSRFSGSLSFDQEISLTQNIQGFGGAALSYVGEREGVFASSAERQEFPGYAKIDLHGGVKYDSWTLNLFVNNVADKRGELAGGIGTIFPFAFNYIQPRTAGLSVAKTF